MRLDTLGRRINPNSHAHLEKHCGWKNHKPTYQCYQDMKQRCYNERSQQFKNYGARGIRVCDKWLQGFESFFEDMGEKPEGMTLDRIDNDGNYSPENCRWASKAEQRRNQRTCVHLEFDGKTMTVEEWARELGMHPETLRTRIRLGFPVEKILTTERFGPVRKNRSAMSQDSACASVASNSKGEGK